MNVVSFNFIHSSSFYESYQSLADHFKKLGISPRDDLEEKIIAAKSLLIKSPRRMNNDELDFLNQLGVDLREELERCNEYYRERKKAENKNELMDLESSLMGKEISEKERNEISLYLNEKIKNTEYIRDEFFIKNIGKVPDRYLLAYIKITQAGLMINIRKEYYDPKFENELMDSLPKLFNELPKNYADRIANILVNSANLGRPAVWILLLADQIPKQLGLLQNDFFPELNVVQEKYHDLYLDYAEKFIEMKVDNDIDILGSFPSLIERNGIQMAKVIMNRALKINEDDFPSFFNAASLYVGLKAGYNYAGDEAEFYTLVKNVEEKYS